MTPSKTALAPALALAVLLVPAFARAQQDTLIKAEPAAPMATPPMAAPPLPGEGETREEIKAGTLFEEAETAEKEGRYADADKLCERILSNPRSGARWREAASGLKGRLVGKKDQSKEMREGEASGPGSRIELAVSATLLGIYYGAMVAATAEVKSSGGVSGLLLLGGFGGLALAMLPTRGMVVPASWAPMLRLGTGFGVWATGMGSIMAGDSPKVGVYLAASAGGTLLGLGSAMAFNMTGGDADAASTGAIFGGAIPGLLALAFSGTNPKGSTIAGVALAGSALGMVSLAVLNRSLHISRGRWTLISLGGGLGFLTGLAVIAMIAESNTWESIWAIPAIGMTLGLGITWWMTDEMQPEARRASRSILDWNPGEGLAFGDVAASLSPVISKHGDGRIERGVMTRVFEARF